MKLLPRLIVIAGLLVLTAADFVIGMAYLENRALENAVRTAFALKGHHIEVAEIQSYLYKVFPPAPNGIDRFKRATLWRFVAYFSGKYATKYSFYGAFFKNAPH